MDEVRQDVYSFFILVAIALDIIFASTFTSEIGRQVASYPKRSGRSLSFR